ncbi:hypothetical protein TorRG33x02_333610 [Trema orientale]|uniref:Uncharacterized protein n=1 Tax=Trema orientale TaxID=63057 RepID=A0A2P5B426_TREOI|nr:hypothetical protein TorRG33x02_333610 [Trema orientale]
MAPTLDRYTTSYLLSGYAFNDFKIKPHVVSHYTSDSDNDSLSLNPRVSGVAGQSSPILFDDTRMGAHGMENLGAHGMEQEVARVPQEVAAVSAAHGFSAIQEQGALQEAARVSPNAGAHGVLEIQTQGAHGMVGEAGDHGFHGPSARVFGDGLLPQAAAHGVLANQAAAHAFAEEPARVFTQSATVSTQTALHVADLGIGHNQIPSTSMPRAAGPSKVGYVIVDSSMVGDGRNALKTTVGGHDARRASQQIWLRCDAVRTSSQIDSHGHGVASGYTTGCF